MNKFVILLTCLVGLTAAGILDKWMLPRNIELKDQELIGTDRILGMSQDELLRQKFLLDILMHVQQPLINEELIRLGQELITDPQRYLNRLDDELLTFIELCRTQRVLGQQDIFSITDDDHLRQMIGLYRMLVNSRDWDTFQRNVCFARVHMNGVLLVNSLLLAVRDREDMRMLIIPAINEILPALFYDENLIRRAQQVDINLLNAQTRRPELLDLIGMGRRRQLLQRNGVLGMGIDTPLDRSQIWMPWREARLELEMRRVNGATSNMLLRNEDKLVLPVERRTEDISLLTNDIGLNGFLYNLINDLVLNEQDILRENRIDRLERVDEDEEQMSRNVGRVGLERNVGSMLEKDRRFMIDDEEMNRNMGQVGLERNVEKDRLTIMGRRTDVDDRRRVDDIDDDRLLHVGRRRLLNRMNMDMDNDRMMMRENRIVGERRQVLERDENLLMPDRQNLNVLRRDEMDLPMTRVDDQRLLHIGRRRLNEMNQRDNFLNIVRGDRINDGRHTAGRKQNMDIVEDRSRGDLVMQNLDEREMLMGRDKKRDRMQLKRRDQIPMMSGERRIDRDMKIVDIDDLPTRRIDDERLVHINRQRLNAELMDNDNDEMLMMRNQRGRMIGEGHRVRNRDERKRQMLDRRDMKNDNRVMDDERRTIDEQRVDDINLRQDDERRRIVDERMMVDNNRQRLGGQMNKIDDMGLRTTTIDDERLLHVNRRRLNQALMRQEQPESFQEMVQRGIRDGRRIIERVDERDRPEELDMRVRNNIDNDRMLKTNRRQRLGMRTDNRQQNLMRGMEDIGTVRLDIDKDRRMNQMDMDDNERIMGLRQQIRDDDDVMQRRRMDNVDKDRLLVIGRRRRVDITDIDTNERRRIPRSVQMDMMNTDRTIMQRLRGGELLLHNLQQLMARIDMERISLRLTDLELNDVDIQRRMNNPRLIDDTTTGQRWALRLNDMRLDTRRNRMLLQCINDIEQSLLLVIERELQGINIRDQRDIDRIVGDILMGGVQGARGILQIMRELMRETNDIQNENTISMIGMLSDPMMQHLLRRIVRIVDVQRQRLDTYRREDIALNGVRINDIVVDRLRTYIDTSDGDLINLLDQRITLQEGDQLQQKMLVARQQRLNHKDFNIKIDLTADREQRVIVRTLLVPKIDANDRVMQLDESRLSALLLDATVVDLHIGQNMIRRKSRDINWTTRDTTPLTMIYQRVMRAINGKLDNILPIKLVGNNCRFPQRLLLPRGRIDGLPMQLLVVITPVLDVDRELQQNILDSNLMCGIGIGTLRMDRLPLGFPLDRRIADVEQLLELPNVLMKDVMIFHENKTKIDLL